MTKNLPRDVFLYLLSIITLVAVAVSLGITFFQIINVYMPDVISDPYFSQSTYYSTLRSALAALIVVFPVLLWVLRFLRKDIEKNPEKKDLKIRKWLIYLTLFAAALVIIGDLVTLLRSFLEGELSQRFILKICAVLLIAGSILIHYLSELKDKNEKFKWILAFDWAVVAVVVVGVVSGFFVAGSPQNQRLVRMDERRIGDLQSIQWQIINYWQRKEVLPENLSDLNDPIGGFIVPRDPETNMNYEYTRLEQLKFQLCGDFLTSNIGVNTGDKTVQPMPVGVYDRSIGVDQANQNWQHDKGRTCYDRTIDTDLYPSLKNQNLKKL